jgi:hypothetical protein
VAKVKTMAELQALLAKLGKGAMDQAGRALYQEALLIQNASMRRTPVDTGALRASHETLQPEGLGDEVKVRIVVGGPSAPYALFVHENLEARHPVGEAKFLERSVHEALPGLPERLARRIDFGKAAG